MAGKLSKQKPDPQMSRQDLKLLADALVRRFHKESRPIGDDIGFQPALKAAPRELGVGLLVSGNTRRLRFDVLVAPPHDLGTIGRNCPTCRGERSGCHERNRGSLG